MGVMWYCERWDLRTDTICVRRVLQTYANKYAINYGSLSSYHFLTLFKPKEHT